MIFALWKSFCRLKQPFHLSEKLQNKTSCSRQGEIVLTGTHPISKNHVKMDVSEQVFISTDLVAERSARKFQGNDPASVNTDKPTAACTQQQ